MLTTQANNSFPFMTHTVDYRPQKQRANYTFEMQET